MGFSRQEYWSGLPFPSPGDLPHPGLPEIAKVDSLPQSHQGSPFINWRKNHICDETSALWPGHSLSGWHAVSFLLLLGSVHFIFPLSWRPQASLLTAPHPQPLPNDAHVPGSRQCWPSHISVALQHDLQQGRLPVTLGVSPYCLTEGTGPEMMGDPWPGALSRHMNVLEEWNRSEAPC